MVRKLCADAAVYMAPILRYNAVGTWIGYSKYKNSVTPSVPARFQVVQTGSKPHGNLMASKVPI